MKTSDIDIFSAQKAASKGLQSPDYQTLAARLLIDNHQKTTSSSFSAKMAMIKDRLSPEFYTFVAENATSIDAEIKYERDFDLDYFGFSTLYNQHYLMRTGGQVIERPQDLWMRVSIFIHMNTKDGLERAFTTYSLTSQKYFIHASPTLFNAGMKRAGCISCFLAATDDSKEAIQRVAVEITNASAACGGVAFSASCIRGKGASIEGSNDGQSTGIIPFIKWGQAGVDAFNQGNRRRGSLAVYLDAHHPDLIDFLKLRVHGGDETQRCRDVFLGLWVSDLFMSRVKKDEMWSFFDSAELYDIYGAEYEKVYCALEKEDKGGRGAGLLKVGKRLIRPQMRAREVWKAIFETKRDSGLPYLLAKDTVNRTNNQKNIGMIKTSNLCAEIVEFCENNDNDQDQSETACCTLASISLPKFVHDENGSVYFDYKRLGEIVHILVQNLNNKTFQ